MIAIDGIADKHNTYAQLIDHQTPKQLTLYWEIIMAKKLKSEFVKFQNLLKKLLQVQPTQKPATDKKNPK